MPDQYTVGASTLGRQKRHQRVLDTGEEAVRQRGRLLGVSFSSSSYSLLILTAVTAGDAYQRRVQHSVTRHQSLILEVELASLVVSGFAACFL
jgi:hypothetical protein